MGNGVDSGGDDRCVGTQGIWEVYLSFFQFHCKPKIALKITLIT